MPGAVADAGQEIPTMRVLIADDDVNLRFTIERRLRSSGMETSASGTVRHAIERLRNEPFDVVLCDLRMAGDDATKLIEWLGSHSPSTSIIVMSEYVTAEFLSLYGRAPNVKTVDKPVEPDAVAKLIEDVGARRGYYGRGVEVELFDYVQMIALTGRDKLIEVATPSGQGLVWFEHGDIVHAEYDDFRGETAFYKLLAVGRGSFREIFTRAPPMRTVTRSSTHLLMEAARQADEGVLGQVPPSRRVDTPMPLRDDEVSFEDLFEREESFASASSSSLTLSEVGADDRPPDSNRPDSRHDGGKPEYVEDAPTGPHLRAVTGAMQLTAPDEDDTEEVDVDELFAPDAAESMAHMSVAESQAAMSTVAGHAIFDDPDMRNVMLEQFWQFEGINGVAIISSTGKVLAEDMRANSSLVTLAGFYMRGAARIARTLGHNVFDGVVARSVNGQQMVMVSMGAASAVLSVEPTADPEQVRDAVMGVE